MSEPDERRWAQHERTRAELNRLKEHYGDQLELRVDPPATDAARALPALVPPPASRIDAPFKPAAYRGDSATIVVGFWPHGVADGVSDATKKVSSEKAKTAVCLFLVVWMLYFWVTCVHSFNYGLFQIFKAMAICMIPLFALFRGTTHLRCDANGLKFESQSLTSNKVKKTVLWRNLSRIYLQARHQGNPMSSVLCFQEKNGQVHKIKLSQI
ncbi:MAG: hypothetical protein ACRD3W_10760, partial [Terriglobales bacterium]